ncbi:hypothetical protein [Roseibium sp. RKSG952]|uniref:hypothetical protein n=1 Tax=Roseibium sp. RKSG952 TaxID=2529384 RepID=UPI0012BC2A69|nr:hypothetical protein [Roseibium sp. RKSG952]MTH97587.1 hypothetical protein [Roseibium sp. RKSG952]
MQILFIVSLSIMLMSMWLFLLEADHGIDHVESFAVAEQMSLWHRGAHDRCIDVGCAKGVVDPAGYLAPVMSAGKIVGRGYFTTRFDTASNLLVTYMADGFVARGNVTPARVAAALRVKTGGQTTQVGFWNATDRIVEPNYSYGLEPTAVVALPSPFAGTVLKDGTPVIVSKLVP